MSWLREPGAEPIPGYRLIEPLGAGGFGEVWKCLAPGDLLKAIKFVFGNIHSEDIDAARAEQEFKALQRVKEVRHRSVLSLEAIYDLDGEIAIVMELADKNMHDLFVEYQNAKQPGIPRGELIEFLKDAAEGLDYLNDQFNLQHLDVKPRNLFVMSGHVKVADFGLVKNIERASSAGMMAGVTPIYAAPETFNGRLSRQCDQYSLAIVYMELLTGKRPFNGKNVRQIALQHISEPPDLNALPEGDRAVVARALAKEPTKRFPTAAAFIRALPTFATGPSDSIDLSDEADLGQMPAGNALPSAISPEEPPPTAEINPRVLGIDLKSGIHKNGKAPKQPSHSELRIPTRTPSRPDGVLRPTLFIGVGGFGRHALLALRCRLLDRFGDLSRLPSVRFLYLDSDPEATQKATVGVSDVALSSNEVFTLPLQPVGNYRRRMLDHLSEWLPREKLYSIPRSLQPQSSRALGRLAFCDNYLRLQARLRRELVTATHADSIEKTVAAANLPAADALPRTFVLASAAEGLSGMLPDLGFALRRLYDQLHTPDGSAVAIVYSGSPADPATPAIEQANVYATLTELHHFHDPSVSFIAQYGPEGPQAVDPRSAFDDVYVTMRRNRTPAAVRECVAHVATFLTHHLSTPLGVQLDVSRGRTVDPQDVAFRSFGTSTVWYPRGLLLRVAARHACGRLLEIWRSSGQPTAPDRITEVVSKATGDPHLNGDALLSALNDAASITGEGTPTEATERYLATIELQAASVEESGVWSAQALERVREWAGTGTSRDPDTTWKKSRFFRNLQMAAAKLADEWDRKLTARALEVLKFPGLRLTNGEAALQQMVHWCQSAVGQQLRAIDRHYEMVKPLRDGLGSAQAQCVGGGGFKLFGGGQQKTLKAFIALLSQFARLRVTQDLLECGLIFYRTLQGRLEDRVKDIGFSRQRLKALEQVLDQPVDHMDESKSGENGVQSDSPPMKLFDPFWDAVQGTETVEIVLPGGVTDLDQSATQFTESLRTEHWEKLDEILHAKVLAPLGNLLEACTGNTNLLKYLGRPLVDAAAEYLAQVLPITDVAQVQFSAAQAGKLNLADDLRHAERGAAPVMGLTGPSRQVKYLLVPASDAGTALGQEAKGLVADLNVVPTGTATECTFIREQLAISVDDLKQILQLGRHAYTETAIQPPMSSHSRFDIQEWVPLEP